MSPGTNSKREKSSYEFDKLAGFGIKKTLAYSAVDALQLWVSSAFIAAMLLQLFIAVTFKQCRCCFSFNSHRNIWLQYVSVICSEGPVHQPPCHDMPPTSLHRTAGLNSTEQSMLYSWAMHIRLAGSVTCGLIEML
jgi:hypothetical protein